MKTIAVLFALMIGILAKTYAQHPQSNDSLKAIINSHTQDDTARVNAIYQYVKSNSTGNTADFLMYLQEILRISKKIHYDFGIRKGYLTGVLYYGDRGNFAQSFLYADSLRNVLKENKKDTLSNDLGLLYLNTGNNYFKMADYQQAINDYTEAAYIFENNNNTVQATNTYLNISGVYELIKDRAKTSEYTVKAYNTASNTNNDRLKAAAILSYVADLLANGNIKEGITKLNEALPLLQIIDNPYQWQNYYYYLGEKEFITGKFPNALKQFNISLKYAYQNDDLHQAAGVLKRIFECELAIGDLNASKVSMDSLLAISKNLGLKMYTKEAYLGYANWYEKKGDWANATHFIRKAFLLNDSILSEERNNLIAGTELKYQIRNKENEILRLQAEQQVAFLAIRQKNILNYILAGSALAILIISLLSLSNYRKKKKLQLQQITELENENQLLATEAVLKGQEEERSRLAKDLHDGLGGMLTGIKYSFSNMKEHLVMTPENLLHFQRGLDMLDSSIEEMRRVAHNMMPEAMIKYGLNAALKDFCTSINSSGVIKVVYQDYGIEYLNLDQATSVTIYRIIQELLNNSIKHANASKAVVQISKEDNALFITVEDDGKGFDSAVLDQAAGIGWVNIRNRLRYLKAKVDVQSMQGKGTSVNIEIDL
jgi:two-component system, NarL family, sensor kinase